MSEESHFIAITVPARHGKSQLVSRYTPAWYMGLTAGLGWEKNIILTSYESDFAAGWGRESRNLLEEWGPRLFGPRATVRADSHAANRWHVAGGGQMVSVGMGGALTGRGGHLIIIDDAVKGWLEAQNPKYREDQWQWYLGTLRTRLEPGGSIILVMTRWHEDDLAGRLRAHMDVEFADQWMFIDLPAVAEVPQNFPGDPDIWTDVLGRHSGDALWPERWPLPALRQIEASVGPLVWDSVYQQHPSPVEGGMFQLHNWRFVNGIPHDTQLVRRWDFAGTEKKQKNDPDWTAGVLMGLDSENRTYIVDVRRIRGEAKEVERFVRATAEEDQRKARKRIPIHIEREGGSSGKYVESQFVSRVLAGFQVEFLPSEGDKVARAWPYASQQQGGNVYLVEGEWNEMFIEEHRQFPKAGAHDDMVDAASLGYLDLVGSEGILGVSSYHRPGRR